MSEIETTLREVCEHLAPIDETPCSAGEREAAEWIVDRLGRAGVPEVALEDEPSWGTFPPTALALGLLGMAGCAAVALNRRATGVALALTSVVGVLDEAENGPRVFRRALRKRRTTVNVVARAGDPDAARTLVLLAHHDGAQTGVLYDQSMFIAINKRFPGVLQRFKTQPPQWAVGVAGQLLAVGAAITGKRSRAVRGLAINALGVALIADIARSPTVPAANDNLSAVAALVAIAERLRDQPITGLRVLLVSAGAEETLQDGIRGFIARHRDELDHEGTWILNMDTIGSPRLIMLEAEGPFVMQEYTDPGFRDLIEQCAREQEIPLERGFRARASTDSVITSRAGYPSTCLGSLNEWQQMSNYHQLSDVPENLDYGTIASAARLVYAVGEAIAAGRAGR
ncbi:MAG TPA: M28 family peptidase [Solirubrobacteraceae bacterium]|nr:M28 family peptidase [Solirubrobacteraceae bacterium]